MTVNICLTRQMVHTRHAFLYEDIMTYDAIINKINEHDEERVWTFMFEQLPLSPMPDIRRHEELHPLLKLLDVSKNACMKREA